MKDPQLLTELYWYVCVVELGSFSAVAQQTGIAKSSLSRKVKSLENRLGVQLLSRGPRKFLMTTIGEEVYRNALEMLSAAQAAKICAEETMGQLGGLVRIAIPAVLSSYLIEILNAFRARNPDVRFEIIYEHELVNTSNIHLDLCLTLQPPPKDSAEIVARPIAKLEQAYFATPELIKRLSSPKHLSQVEDRHLLVLGQGSMPMTVETPQGTRQVVSPSLASPNLQTLKDAAKAGLGIACLPALSCREEAANKQLRTTCQDDQLPPLLLTSQTPPFRGITPSTRQLIKTISSELERYTRN